MMSRRLLPVLVAAPTLTALVACTSGAGNLAGDATVTSCEASPTGDQPTATGQVVNHSSKGSGFLIRIGFYDSSGNRVSDGGDTVNGVDPGQSAPWHTTGATSAKGPLTCKVISVSRYVAPGS